MRRFLRWLLRIEAYDPERDDVVKQVEDASQWLKDRRRGNPIEDTRFPHRHQRPRP